MIMGLLSALCLDKKFGFSSSGFEGNVSSTGPINSIAGGGHCEKESL